MEEMKECEESVNYIHDYALSEYEINIKLLSKGCIVSVGCKSFAFEDKIKAIKEVEKYINNPKKTLVEYKEYIK